tara:strand:- start:369 stop:704 length:336 start_codon:yes stop_codon:yes gene_type:complete
MNRSYEELQELAELDLQAREGINRFDKANSMSGEISLETGLGLIEGFQAVDVKEDADYVEVDEDEKLNIRQLADFYVTNGCSPAGAMETARVRELSSTPYLDVDELELSQH